MKWCLDSKICSEHCKYFTLRISRHDFSKDFVVTGSIRVTDRLKEGEKYIYYCIHNIKLIAK